MSLLKIKVYVCNEALCKFHFKKPIIIISYGVRQSSIGKFSNHGVSEDRKRNQMKITLYSTYFDRQIRLLLKFSFLDNVISSHILRYYETRLSRYLNNAT